MPDLLSLLKKAQPPKLPIGPLITLPAPPQLQPTDQQTAVQPIGAQPLITLPAEPQLQPTDQNTYQGEQTPTPTDTGTYEGPKQPSVVEMSPARIAELLAGFAEGSLQQAGDMSDTWFVNKVLETKAKQSPQMAQIINELRRPEFEDAYARGLKNIEIFPIERMRHPLLGGQPAGGFYDPNVPSIVVGEQTLPGYMNPISRALIMHELSHHIDEMNIITKSDAIDWSEAMGDDMLQSQPGMNYPTHAAARVDPSGQFASQYAKQLFETQTKLGQDVQTASREDFAEFAASWITSTPDERVALNKVFPNRTALLQMHLQDMADRAQGGQATTVSGNSDSESVTSPMQPIKFEEHPADSGTIHATTMEFAAPPTADELQQVQQQLAEQNGWRVLQATPLDAGEKKYYLTFGALNVPGSTPAARGVVQFPPFEDNYTKPLAQFGPSMYRQMTVDEANRYLPDGSNPALLSGADHDRVYMANVKHLALGQEGNRGGVVVEFDTANLQGQLNRSKPTWQALYAQNEGEFLVRHTSEFELAQSVKSITLPQKLALRASDKARLQRRLTFMKESGWEITNNDDGTTTYTRPTTSGE